LGWVGVALLAIILITRYSRIVAAVRQMAPLANVRLAYFIVAVVYNFTEAGFKMMHPVWITFLLAIMVVPDTPPAEDQPPIPLVRTDRFATRNFETVRPTVRV
jgi:hypothetical protein